MGVTLLFLLIIVFPYTLSSARAADMDLKPGDVIGPENWQRVQGMVGENLLRRIKQGYTIKIKEPRYYRPAEGISTGDGKILRRGWARSEWRASQLCRGPSIPQFSFQRPSGCAEGRVEFLLALVGR